MIALGALSSSEACVIAQELVRDKVPFSHEPSKPGDVDEHGASIRGVFVVDDSDLERVESRLRFIGVQVRRV